MPALKGDYVVQPSLIEHDRLALVCPNCGVHIDHDASWFASAANLRVPCPLCGVTSRIPPTIGAA